MANAPSSIADIARLFQRLAGGPASVRRALDLAMGVARGRAVFRRARRDGHVYVGGPIHVDARGEVSLGHGVLFFGGMIASEIVCHPGASVAVGAGSELNYGVSIEARQRVRIGARCKIGSMVHITDAGRDRVDPVTIGDDVWIAHGAVIEPGASIGDGSVVSAGSVVTGAIPPGCLAVGNPARAVRLETMAGSASA